MGSFGDEDVQVLHNQSSDEHYEDMDKGWARQETFEGHEGNRAVGEDSIMMYEESFRSGVRFPLSEPLRSFLNDYNITIRQFHLNVLRLSCSIIALACKKGHSLTAQVVRELYHFSVRSNKDHCFLQAKNNYNIFSRKSKISSLKNWKSKFFFVKCPGRFGVPIRRSEDQLHHLPASPTPYYQICVQLIKEMAPKKSKSSKMAKVAEVMKRKVVTESAEKEAPSVAINANSVNFTRITKLNGDCTEMEVKKNKMEDTVKSAEVLMKEQEAQHKADITAWEVDIDKRKGENWGLLNRNKDLESKMKEMENKLQKLRDEKGWINDVYPDGGDENEEEEGNVDRLVDYSSLLRVDTKVSADIHPISSEGRGAAEDGSFEKNT
ncbi:hypothetical protein JCGZ_20290 [Jatropha curcas]|uniref:Uncharacterized protein n=1 Tax=Jatropha curcas TaxID=180498 RepID=A0A067JTU5_JATCU|nr:hypothetical protein JCGZ_20290 [Jatropha curcas]